MKARTLFFGTLLIGSLVGPMSAYDTLYTFSETGFAVNQFAPFNSIAPSVGPLGFYTDFFAGSNQFTTEPNFQFNSLFTGASIYSPTPSTVQSITLSFSVPIVEFSVDFATLFSGTGRLVFQIPGVASGFNIANLVDYSPYGGNTLSYSSTTPFSTVIFSAQDQNSQTGTFALDNLRLTTSQIPEASTFSAITASIGIIIISLRRRIDSTAKLYSIDTATSNIKNRPF